MLVAAPRDARAVFDSSMSLEQVTAKVAQVRLAGVLPSVCGLHVEEVGMLCLGCCCTCHSPPFVLSV